MDHGDGRLAAYHRRAAGGRLPPRVLERAGALFPPGVLHRPLRPAPALPACVELGDLTEEEAERARGRYGLPPGAPAAPDARHPLSLRLLAEVGAALTEGDGTGRCADEPAGLGTPDRHQIFDAYLDLVCLRIAVRLAAGHRPPSRAAAVRRLAAQVAGQVHEAARRCLGPGPGALDRTSFEEVFPREPGWARAVLAEGLLVRPAPDSASPTRSSRSGCRAPMPTSTCCQSPDTASGRPSRRCCCSAGARGRCN